MRVISQDGKIDIPYDYFSLYVSWAKIASGKVEDRNVFSIVCHNLSSPNGTKLAEYSTEGKAKKAMKQLHDVYEDYLAEGTPDGNGFCFVSPKVFQFPAEEELE